MADLFDQPLKSLMGLLDRFASGVPGQSGADNILYPDLREQIGDEIVPNAPQKTILVDNDEVGLWDSEDSDLLKGVLLVDVEVYIREKGGPIIANQGVDADASKPVSGLTAGDIFVSNDTFKKYTAIDATTWDAGVVLLVGQIITDSTTAENDRYQYDDTQLLKFYNINDLGFALSDETSDLTTDNDGEREVIRATTLQSITLYVNTAPTGSAIICEISKGATLIETITLPAGSTTVTVANTTTFAVGDRLKANITQVGATVAGAGAKIETKGVLT